MSNNNLLRFDAPAELFGEGKFVMRRRKIKLKTQEEIKAWPQEDMDGLYEFIARLIPEWNLDDCDTGEPLPHPKDDPAVFLELDVEEADWVLRVLNPPRRR